MRGNWKEEKTGGWWKCSKASREATGFSGCFVTSRLVYGFVKTGFDPSPSGWQYAIGLGSAELGSGFGSLGPGAQKHCSESNHSSCLSNCINIYDIQNRVIKFSRVREDSGKCVLKILLKTALTNFQTQVFGVAHIAKYLYMYQVLFQVHNIFYNQHII